MYALASLTSEYNVTSRVVTNALCEQFNNPASFYYPLSTATVLGLATVSGSVIIDTSLFFSLRYRV